LSNGDFEAGAGNEPFFWTADVWLPQHAVVSWEESPAGRNNSRAITIENTEENDSRWIQAISGLIPGASYVLSGYIRGENVAVGSGEGANIGLFGTWQHTAPLSGTFDWTRVQMTFTSPPSGEVVIGCRLGYWGGASTGKAWFDDISVELQ
jgi:hypothetical protein